MLKSDEQAYSHHPLVVSYEDTVCHVWLPVVTTRSLWPQWHSPEWSRRLFTEPCTPVQTCYYWNHGFTYLCSSSYTTLPCACGHSDVRLVVTCVCTPILGPFIYPKQGWYQPLPQSSCLPHYPTNDTLSHIRDSTPSFSPALWPLGYIHAAKSNPPVQWPL